MERYFSDRERKHHGRRAPTYRPLHGGVSRPPYARCCRPRVPATNHRPAPTSRTRPRKEPLRQGRRSTGRVYHEGCGCRRWRRYSPESPIRRQRQTRRTYSRRGSSRSSVWHYRHSACPCGVRYAPRLVERLQPCVHYSSPNSSCGPNKSVTLSTDESASVGRASFSTERASIP